MKRMILILLCLMMAVSSAYAQGEYIGTMKVVNCEEWVSLREKPDARSERIVKVPLGALVENCRTESKTFIYAEYGGKSGYIASEYLEEAEATHMSLGDLRVANCNEWVNMRAEPDAGSKRLAKVPLGASFEDCTAAENGYIFGHYNGQQGYISAEYLVSAQTYTSDRHLADCRVVLAGRGQVCGAVLLSQSVGGNTALARERERLEEALADLPQMWREMALSIPADRLVEIAGGKELYLIIPMDEAASVSINELTPGTTAERGSFKKVAYNSRRGDPFLLRCNAAEQPWEKAEYQPEWETVFPVFDCEVNIVDGSGRGVTWYPRTDGPGGSMQTQGAAGEVFDLAAQFGG